MSSYKDHLHKDQVLNPTEFMDHQYWSFKDQIMEIAFTIFGKFTTYI